MKNCVDWERLHNSIKAEREEFTNFLKKHNQKDLKALELYINRMKTIAHNGSRIYGKNAQLRIHNKLVEEFLEKQEKQIKELKEKISGGNENE